MQQKTPSKGTFFALIAIVVVALGMFFYFKGSPSDVSISSLATEGSVEAGDAQASSQRIVNLLNQISSLKIDDSIFKSAVYKSLVDYTIAIPEQNVGRANPFVPVN